MRVLVTGAAGYFGGAVLRSLVADPAVTAVVATDLRAPAFTDPKVGFFRRDLVAEGAADLLEGCDAVIHLAFTVERRPGVDPAVLNLAAGRAFLAAALAAPRVVVFASSVMAYGFRSEAAGLLVETDLPGPAQGFYYAEQKIAAEAMLAELAAESPARLVVARPCAVGGPRLDPRRGALYRGPLQLMPSVGHPLRVQLLHEDDLGAAFRVLLGAPAGAYNLAPDDSLESGDIARLLGQWQLALPMGLCTWVLDHEWRAGRSLMDGDWARTLRYPAQVASNAKLRGLGWAPRFTTGETALATRAGVLADRDG